MNKLQNTNTIMKKITKTYIDIFHLLTPKLPQSITANSQT